MILKTRGILLIILMMHSCFIPMSCMTVESYRGSNISKEQFSVDKVRSIHLKSGEKLLMEDTQIRLLKLTNGSVYAFLINAFDTTWSGDKKNYTVSASLDTIGIEDVREIITQETDVPLTILAVLGIAVGVLLIVYIIGIGTSNTPKLTGFGGFNL